MAKKLDRSPGREPFRNGFSYDQAFDGATWQLVRGEDFDLAPSTISGYLRDEYERRYGRLVVKVDGDRVTVQRIGGR